MDWAWWGFYLRLAGGGSMGVGGGELGRCLLWEEQEPRKRLAEAVAEGDEGALEVAEAVAEFVAADGGAEGFGPGGAVEVAVFDGGDEAAAGEDEEVALHADFFELAVGDVDGEAGGAGDSGDAEVEEGEGAFFAAAAVGGGGGVSGITEADAEVLEAFRPLGEEVGFFVAEGGAAVVEDAEVLAGEEGVGEGVGAPVAVEISVSDAVGDEGGGEFWGEEVEGGGRMGRP